MSWKKDIKKTVDQTMVERFGVVRNGDLNGPIRSENFPNKIFLIWFDFNIRPNQMKPCAPLFPIVH